MLLVGFNYSHVQLKILNYCSSLTIILWSDLKLMKEKIGWSRSQLVVSIANAELPSIKAPFEFQGKRTNKAQHHCDANQWLRRTACDANQQSVAPIAFFSS